MAQSFGFGDVELSRLRDPALVVAFSGWSDAGQAASDVLNHLATSYEDTSTVCRIDGEEYYDYQVNRPQIIRGPEGSATIWPETIFQLVSTPDRDLILLGGPEPNYRWRSFVGQVMEEIYLLDPKQAVILGAMLTDTPHSRPLPVNAYSSDRAFCDRLRCEESSYEGPTGIPGILSKSFETSDISTVSLWVSVPHYVSSTPNPKATLALLRKTADALDIPLVEGELPEEAQKWQQTVDAAAGSDPDVREYVDKLESLRDKEDLRENTGDDIADELERFLRHRSREGHQGLGGGDEK